MFCCKGVLQTVALKSDRVDDSKRTRSPKGEPKLLDSSLMNCRVSWEVGLYPQEGIDKQVSCIGFQVSFKALQYCKTLNLMEIIWRFSHCTKNEMSFPLAQRIQRWKYDDWGMCKGSQSNCLVLSRATKLLNYHQTWNESKETNFLQIIKPLSFMTQSQWKLPSLCLCPAVEKKKEQTWGNKGMIMELEPVCGSGGTSVHVRHWGLARYGRSAIPKPDWVQIKSCFIIWMEGKEWAKMANNLFGGNICEENHIRAFRDHVSSGLSAFGELHQICYHKHKTVTSSLF